MMKHPGSTLTPHQERLIGEIRSILSGQDSICAAYLFGSFLHSDIYHDIDLAIFLMQNPDPYERYKLANRIGQDVEQKIHPRIHVDVRILNNAPITLTYEVISTGILLMSNNDTETAGFEAGVLIRYLDMQPWFDSLDRQYLEALSG